MSSTLKSTLSNLILALTVLKLTEEKKKNLDNGVSAHVKLTKNDAQF